MKKNELMCSKLRTCGVGFSAMLLLFACGGDSDSEKNRLDSGDVAGPVDVMGPSGELTPPGEDLREQVVDPMRDPCLDNPLLAGCSGAVSPPGATIDLPTAAVENILRANCGQCHGSAILDEEDAEAGMNYIDDFERLLEEGQAIPGNSEGSPIIRRMRDGTMPPFSSTGPRPSPADINAVADYLDDSTRFATSERTEVCNGQLLSFDDLYEQLQSDILAVDADDRPFARYVLLSNRFNQGVCSEALDVDRFGMNKMLNMLSTNVRGKEAFSINSEETIYRIDLRDYNWDREIVVNGVVFNDGWEAIVAANPYAIQFQGDEAEQVIEQARTNVTWMFADSMVDVASIGNLYYALIDVDVDDSLDDFILDDLGIDVEANLDQEQVVRAGTTQSIISRQDRVAERHDINVRQGVFWQSFDFAADEANESIFEDPFGFTEGGREVIFSLPNGMMAFLIADENDVIVEESNILLDTLQNDFVARTSVSCSGCHAQGYLPMVDEVRRVVEANPLNFEADEFEAVQDVYVTPAQFSTIIERDSQDYLRALSGINIPTRGADPVSGVFLTFARDLGLEEVAGDLGVSAELLDQNIALLDPALQVIRGGGTTIDRDDYTNLYEASLCVMQTFSQNQPLEANCEIAIEALGN